MKNVLKRFAKDLLHSAGFEVLRYTPHNSPALQLKLALNHFNIDLVLDVGANTGQFASELRSIGFKGDIVSFEPLSDAYQQLAGNASADPKWRVHERCAIGDADGEVEINISGNSVSSSVLPMTELLQTTAEDSIYIGSEKVKLFRLDTVAPAYMAGATKSFMKIDTQGFEWQVLDGAKAVLPKVTGILCELSLASLYKDQHLWQETSARLEAEGFKMWSLSPVFIDPNNGKTLQFDATFFRS